MKYIIALWMALNMFIASAYAEPVATVSSPDKSIVAHFDVDNDGRVLYSIMRKGKLIIAPSRLGFLLTDSYNMVRNFALVDQTTNSGDDTWEQPWGERRFVKDKYTEIFVRFQQKSGLRRIMAVRLRVFDTGIGFRYEIPDQPNLKVMNIAEELTEFDVAQKGTAWWIQGGEWNRYEQIYQKTSIDAVATAHTPITMKLDDGTHLAFHEAAIVDYAGMWFKRGEGQRFRSMLSPSSRGPKVIRQTPFNTPWRTLRIGDTAAALVENDIDLNLNEPNKLGDVSWVKPYKYIGIWWEMHLAKSSWSTGPKLGATTANALRHIDFAAKHGFRGVLIEGWNIGWDGDWFGHGDDFSFTKPTPFFDLEKITAYAKKKAVHLVGHHETGGNIANYEPQLEDAMKLYARLGVDSVKTGYVADAGGIIAPGDKPGETRFEWHDGQRMSVHHLDVVKMAAKYRIAVNPHEPIKDSGLRRTYPNWVAREGARGMEYNAWGAPDNGPAHEPTLIYTRMLSGPMDFTPGVLSLTGQRGNHLSSTLARQLSLYIVLYSPIQMAADLIDNLALYPRELEFISKVPSDWSESHLLAGDVGESALFARKDRNSQDWYIGAITDGTERKMAATLDFLDAGKSYTATIYRDGDDADYKTEKRHSIIIEKRSVKKGDTLLLRLAAAGGAAVRLHPAK
jgi:alpha-glucosidase